MRAVKGPDMGRGGWIPILIVLVSTSMTLAVSSADAAVLTPELMLSKHKSGPYTPNLDMNLQPGKVKDVFERVRNLNDNPLEYRLEGPAQVLDYRFKYFKPNGTNITGAVTGGGYEFTIGDRAKKFRLRVKLPSDGDPDGACAFLSVVDDMAAQDDDAVLVLNGPC